MAKTIKQPSANPTNKLTAATVGAAAMAALYWALEAAAPGLPNEQLVVGLTPFAVFVSGWFVKDAPNA